MSISKHEEKMINIQHQMRENQTDLQSYLADLDNWENDIKKKEEKIKTGNTQLQENQDLPPVRNSIQKPKFKKKKKEKKPQIDKPKKISGFDFQAWDKFDVDKALEEVDKEEPETSSSEYETDEEWEMERMRHLATEQKDQGNKHFKNGEWDKAVEAYSKGVGFDATSAVLPANRAMALLKQQKFAAAELDCTTSISLDPLYVKAYLRRATARVGLDKYLEAKEDYNRVLDLEPTNKLAKTELERLQKELDRDKEAPPETSLTENNRGVIKPIYKSPEERSKVPLRRIHIEEIGIQTSTTKIAPAYHSQQAKKIEEQESKNFEAIISSSKSNASGISDKTASETNQKSGKEDLQQQENHVQSKSIPISTETKSSVDTGRENGALNPSEQKSVIEEKSEKLDMKVKKDTSKQVRENGLHHKQAKQATQGDSEESLSVPQSSFQFQKDFKILKKKSSAFFNYVKNISPSQYPKLLGQCLDSDILMTIVNALLENAEGTDVNVYEMLLGLTEVNRFSMTAMFLSKKEKQGIQNVMKLISTGGKYSDSDISALKKKYTL